MRKLLYSLVIGLIIITLVPQAHAIYCGQRIRGKTITMNQTLQSCDRFGVILEDNSTLDCNGHAIWGRGVIDSYGIGINGKNITIKNCETYDFTIGSYFLKAEDAHLDGFIMLEKGEVGIYLRDSKNITINNIWLRDQPSGIISIGSADISVQGGNITKSKKGITLDKTSGAVMSDLLIDSQYSGMEATASQHIKVNGLTTINPVFGISLSDCGDALITDNSIFAKDIGILSDHVAYITASRNELRMMREGIRFGDSNHATAENNNLGGNRFGISVINSDDSLISNNTVSESSDSNIILERSNRTVVAGNLLYSSPYGIKGSGQYHQQLSRNTISGHMTGIDMKSSKASRIIQNAFGENTDDLKIDDGLVLWNLFLSWRPVSSQGIILLNRHSTLAGLLSA